MSIHVTRENMLHGSGAPQISAEFYGQIYINTDTSPREVWVAGAENNAQWVKLSSSGHVHKVADISDLRTTITEMIQHEGIEAALISMRGGNNSWDGDWNNFRGIVRVQGQDVITKGSSIGDLKDVDVSDGLATNTLLGWNGSKFVPFKISGASPSTGGIDFSTYVTKDDLVSDFQIASTTKALSANGAKSLYETIKKDFALKDHTHTGFAATNHVHKNYLDKTIAQTMTKNLTLDIGNDAFPLTLRNNYGKINFVLPEKELGETPFQGISSLEFSGGNGKDLRQVMIGGTDGSILNELVLNFSSVVIPSGGLKINETKKSLGMPPMKITSTGIPYIGSLARTPSLDLNNGAMIGTKQIVFRSPASTSMDGLFFPKTFAGNGQPTETGYYHYLRLNNNEMITDTALASEQKYISLNNVRIFFSVSDPGRDAREGDIWIKI